MGTVRALLEAEAPRVAGPERGVAAVPQVRPAVWSTYAFEETCAWLAAHAACTRHRRVVAGVLRTWQAWSPIWPAARAGWAGCAVSVSMRSPTAAGTGICAGTGI